jgi:hypothetical protein
MLPMAALCQADSAWFVNNYTKQEVYVTMRDGVRLFTTIYAPNDNSVNHPILLKRTPYSCAPYGTGKMPYQITKTYLKKYLEEGYILVSQDVRGRWMSEGSFVDVRPYNPNKKDSETDESSDTYDTIDWLVRNVQNNNGKVGVFGISYPGFYSTMAAACNHPALKAVSPQAPVTNWFIGDDFHHNGAFFQMDGFAFYSSFGKPRPQPTTVPPTPFDFYTHDSYKFYLESGSLQGLAKLMGDSIAFWKELYTHPDYDDWWKARDARNAVKNLQPAMLWVGGLFDAEDCWGAWNSYKAAEANNPPNAFNKIVNGPWYHGQWASNDGTALGHLRFGSNTSTYFQDNIEVPFFNYFLKDKGDISQWPEAMIFITGSNEWKSFKKWPPARVQQETIYFSKQGQLQRRMHSSKEDFSSYTSIPTTPVPYTEDVHFHRTIEYMTDDQRFAARRPDVLTFQTPVLDTNYTVTGPIVADLFVSLSSTDADFVVKIIDVFPDKLNENEEALYEGSAYPMEGYQLLVRGEIFRGRYRNSFEKPEAFIPGKVERVKFELPDIAHTFKKGHRLMVQIQSSWFPLVSMNPQHFVNVYNVSEKDFVSSTIQLYHNSIFPSAIILPVLGSKKDD